MLLYGSLLSLLTVAGILCILLLRPALEDIDTKISYTLPLSSPDQTAVIGLHVRNKSRFPLVLKSVVADLDDGVILVGSYTDGRLVVGADRGPLHNSPMFAEPPVPLANFSLMPQEATTLLFEFQASLVEESYEVRNFKVYYRHNGVTKAWMPDSFQVLRIIKR